MSATENKARLAPLIMIGLGILLIILAVIWFGQSNPPPAISQVDPPTPTVSPPIPYPDIFRVSLEEAKAAFDAGQAVFIDTRGELFFSQGHIKGARLLTDQDIPARLTELDPEAWYITYCT